MIRFLLARVPLTITDVMQTDLTGILIRSSDETKIFCRVLHPEPIRRSLPISPQSAGRAVSVYEGLTAFRLPKRDALDQKNT